MDNFSNRTRQLNAHKHLVGATFACATILKTNKMEFQSKTVHSAFNTQCISSVITNQSQFNEIKIL